MYEQLKEIDPSGAICFSGHRPERLPGYGDPNSPKMKPLITALQQELVRAVEQGKTTRIHGCRAGWDIVCGEQAINIKKQFPHVRIISVAPYSANFFSKEKCWTPEWVSRAREVFRQHDYGISLTDYYHSGIYYERNRVLISHSSMLICYYDGKGGGTKYTVDRAIEKGMPVQNLYER